MRSVRGVSVMRPGMGRPVVASTMANVTGSLGFSVCAGGDWIWLFVLGQQGNFRNQRFLGCGLRGSGGRGGVGV